VLALLLALAVSADLETISQEQEKLFEKMASGVVYISCNKGFGSGFFVSESGLILTNAHVVTGSDTVTVVLHDGRRFQGAVVERGTDDIDVALVKIPLTGAPTLQTDKGNPRVGQWVAAIGHGAGAVWTFSSGMVSNVYSEGSERPVFQTQIPLNPGNSGGPIFNSKGEVLGLVTSGLKEATAINFGISMDVARRSLKGLVDLCQCVRVVAPAGLPVFFDDKMVGTGPVAIATGVKSGSHEVFVVKAGKMTKRALQFPAVRTVDLNQ
jgi:serine protease Do